jgi:hypothetical protein
VGEGSAARWNPIDTILYEPGAEPFNTFGPNGRYHVWSYATMVDGIRATADTLAGWAEVAAAFAQGMSAQYICACIDAADGVGGTLYVDVLPSVVAAWPAAGQVAIAGSGSPPVPTIPKEPTMILAKATNTNGPWYIIDASGRREVGPTELAGYNALLGPLGAVRADFDPAQLAGIRDVTKVAAPLAVNSGGTDILAAPVPNAAPAPPVV